jgi:hypothetical protein
MRWFCHFNKEGPRPDRLQSIRSYTLSLKNKRTRNNNQKNKQHQYYTNGSEYSAATSTYTYTTHVAIPLSHAFLMYGSTHDVDQTNTQSSQKIKEGPKASPFIPLKIALTP